MDWNKANVDIVHNNSAQGEVGNEMLSQGRLNVGMYRPFIAVNKKTGKVGAYASMFMGGDASDKNNYKTVPINVNATLRRDEWRALDEAVLNVARDRLVAIQDLISYNLEYNLGNAMGTTVLEWHDQNDPFEASVDMNADTRSQNDRIEYQHNFLPIPIIHSDYQINQRHLEASRRLGNPIDTSAAENASRRVNEKLENMLVTDTSFSFGAKDERGRNSIYSYLNHPDRQQVTLDVPWDDSAKTAEGIKTDVLDMKQAAINAKHYGPFIVYIPTSYEKILDDDYDTDGTATQTIRERLLAISGIDDIKVCDRLPDDNVVMVEMNRNTVRLIRGLGITNVQWSEQGGFVQKFKVMTIQVPQIRSDSNGNTGIIHLA